METYYTVYKVTNQINGKIYIGCHKTKDLNDGYMGSGKYLKRAIAKHGIENFTKEILEVFETSEEMFALEAEIVNEDFLSEENTYNLKLGGSGGWGHLNQDSEHQKKANAFSQVAQRKKFENDPEWVKSRSKKLSETMKKVYREGGKVSTLDPQAFKGKTHTEETKKKISEAVSKSQSGKGNSQYGTMWIYNILTLENRKIKAIEPIPEGWAKGRKMKI